MTRVMICGARRREDISLVVEAGADAIGLITEVWQNLSCNLSRTEARELTQLVPPFVTSVLILTEERVDEIYRMAEYVLPDILQLHGFNTPEGVATLKEKLGIRIIKTLHFQGKTMAEGDDPIGYARQYISAGASAILVDSYQANKVGATGETMSLLLARQIRDAIRPTPLILAGGLHIDNVAEAINAVQPYAVDVFSGVISGGYLAPHKLKAFVNKVHLGKVRS